MLKLVAKTAVRAPSEAWKRHGPHRKNWIPPRLVSMRKKETKNNEKKKKKPPEEERVSMNIKQRSTFVASSETSFRQLSRLLLVHSLVIHGAGCRQGSLDGVDGGAISCSVSVVQAMSHLSVSCWKEPESSIRSLTWPLSSKLFGRGGKRRRRRRRRRGIIDHFVALWSQDCRNGNSPLKWPLISDRFGSDAEFEWTNQSEMLLSCHRRRARESPPPPSDFPNFDSFDSINWPQNRVLPVLVSFPEQSERCQFVIFDFSR